MVKPENTILEHYLVQRVSVDQKLTPVCCAGRELLSRSRPRRRWMRWSRSNGRACGGSSSYLVGTVLRSLLDLEVDSALEDMGRPSDTCDRGSGSLAGG